MKRIFLSLILTIFVVGTVQAGGYGYNRGYNNGYRNGYNNNACLYVR